MVEGGDNSLYSSNPRRVGYIVPIHGPLDGPLYMGSIYSNNVNHSEADIVIVRTEKDENGQIMKD